jgi:hypothetical protein
MRSMRNLHEALAKSADGAQQEIVLQGRRRAGDATIGVDPHIEECAGMRRVPPRLGEHTEEVLAEARAMAAASLD